jgi:phosphoribosylformylglycinamidine synthase subunit PurS
MKYFVYVAIERKEAILDPQGKATEHALSSLGFQDVSGVRIGKMIRLAVEASSPDAAREIASQASQKLLSNPIMETFSIVTVNDQPVLEMKGETV